MRGAALRRKALESRIRGALPHGEPQRQVQTLLSTCAVTPFARLRFLLWFRVGRIPVLRGPLPTSRALRPAPQTTGGFSKCCRAKKT